MRRLIVACYPMPAPFANFDMSMLTPVWEAVGGAAQSAWQWLTSLEVPPREEVVKRITELSPTHAAVMLVAGLIYLLQGWRVFKFLVVVNAAIAGMLIGSIVGATQSQAWSLYGMLIGGGVLALLCWPLMRLAIALTGALAGGAAGLGVWDYVAGWHPTIEPYTWVGGVGGALILGVLAFCLFRLVVIVITALQGSALTVGGILALALMEPHIRKPLQNALENNEHLLPALLAVPAFIGIIAQTVFAPKKTSVPSVTTL